MRVSYDCLLYNILDIGVAKVLNYTLLQIVGVAQVINKKDEEGPFTANDEKIFERYLTFCGIGITNALLFQSSVIMYKRSDVSLMF